MNRPILCLTPVKNEEWILDRFIQCALLWADKIVILDQGSEDRTPAIAKSYSDVIYEDIGEIEYNEGFFRKRLIETARKYSKNAILISIDADEALSSRIFDGKVMDRICALKEGTGFSFKLANIDPSYDCYWEQLEPTIAGFVDDGDEYNANWISTPRFPLIGKPILEIEEVKLLHFQYVDWHRMESKQRWYKVKEKINDSNASSIRIYRRYTHMYRAMKGQKPLDPLFFIKYEENGIDMRAFKKTTYWWDKKVIEMLKTQKSLEEFKFLDVVPDGLVDDKRIDMIKRSGIGRAIRWYLKYTTQYYPAFPIRAIDKLLRIFIKYA